MTGEPQHLAALARANEHRVARADLKDKVAQLPRLEGRERVAEIVIDPPACVANMPIATLLAWPRRDGERTACRRLDGLPWPTRVGEQRPVGHLTARERQVIAVALTRELEAAA